MSAAAEESSTVKVLNGWRSMFGMRVLLALQEKGVEYEYQEEEGLPSYNKSELLLEANPVYKKVPVLIHKGKPICESLIIVQYIDEVWPSQDKPFLPTDPYQRALARFWADYVDKKVAVASDVIYRSVEKDAMEQAKRDLLECMVTLDGALRDVFGGGPYFGGKHINLVDIALAPFLCWFETYERLANFKLLEESKCPYLFNWAKVVLECPTAKNAFSIAPPEKVFESVCWTRKKFFGA